MRAHCNLVLYLIEILLSENMLSLSLRKMADANPILLSTYLSVDGAMLPTKQKSHRFESSVNHNDSELVY